MAEAYLLVLAEPDENGRLWRDFDVRHIDLDHDWSMAKYNDATVRFPGKAIMLVRFSIEHGLIHEASNVPIAYRTLCGCVSGRTHLVCFYRAMWEQGLAYAVDLLIPEYAQVYVLSPL